MCVVVSYKGDAETSWGPAFNTDCFTTQFIPFLGWEPGAWKSSSLFLPFVLTAL